MARQRNISSMEALFVSPTGGGTEVQLHRITSCNRDFTINRTDVSEFGVLAAIDKVITEPPTVNLNFEYLATNVLNENRMGFVTNFTASAISGFLNTGTASQKNYYLLKTAEGIDAVGGDGTAGNNYVEGIGNGFISNATWRGSVGDFARAAIAVEGLNWRVYTNSTGQVCPSVDVTNGADVTTNLFTLPAAVSGLAGQISAIAQGDITLSISGTLGLNVSDLKIQSYEVSAPLARTTQSKFGTKFPFARHINFPVDATMQIVADVGDLQTGSISALVCADASVNCRVTLATPACGGGDAARLRRSPPQVRCGRDAFSCAHPISRTFGG